jgi:hypothetical protein
MSLFEAHDIESEVVDAIRAMPEVDDVFVHVDPKELGEWKRDADSDRLVGTAVAGEGDAPPHQGARDETSESAYGGDGDADTRKG